MAQQLDPKTSAKQGGLSIIKDRMDKAAEENAATIHAHGIDKETFAKLCCEALMNVPGMDQCDERSFFAAVHKCFKDGLVPDGNEAVIYPKKRYEGGKEAVYLPMLHGMKRVIHRTIGAEITSGHILKSEEGSVDIIAGTNPSITYKRNLDVGEDDYVIGAWAYARIPDKVPVLHVMNRHDLAEAKKKSASYDGAKDSPWGNEKSRGYDGFMSEKTCVKSLATRLQYLKGGQGISQMLANDDEYVETLGQAQIATPAPAATQIEDQRPAATIDTAKPAAGEAAGKGEACGPAHDKERCRLRRPSRWWQPRSSNRHQTQGKPT